MLLQVNKCKRRGRLVTLACADNLLLQSKIDIFTLLLLLLYNFIYWFVDFCEYQSDIIGYPSNAYGVLLTLLLWQVKDVSNVKLRFYFEGKF